MGETRILDTRDVRAALMRVTGAEGQPLVPGDSIAAIDQEDAWLAITLGGQSPNRSTLARIHAQLSGRWPDHRIELRSGNIVHRGGRGFGEGRHVVAVLGGKGGVGKSTIAVNLGLTWRRWAPASACSTAT